MPVFEFKEWLPDVATFGNPGVVEAKNVIPKPRGFGPVSELSTTSNALDARPRGASAAIDSDLNVLQYAGDAAKLYENVDETWTDRSKSGGYSTGDEERWEFAQWKNKILAVNFDDNPQQLTLGGTTFSDLTTAFKARRIAVVRDFVVVGNTFDSSDGNVTHRVRWSAIDDETDWTVSASTLADFQDLKKGPVEQIMGGQFGVVFQNDSVWRMTFVGSPTVFQFDEVLPGIGAIAPGSVIQFGNFIYFLSERGFFSIRNGTTAEPIGANKVDNFVLGDIDNDHLNRMSVAADESRIYWAYPGSGNSSGRPNKVVVYDRTLDKWSIIEDEIEFIWSAPGAALSLEDLDNQSASIDALSLSLDSSAWKGGKRTNLAAFDENFKNGFFDSATNMQGTIKTAEFELTPGRQTHLNAFRHVVDGGSVTAKVGTRDNQADSISFGSSLSERTSNRFTPRSNARYHSFQFDITGDYSEAIGMQIERDDIKAGGRRGV